MIHITFDDLKQFILAQPPDRPVNMLQCMSSDPCGCLMVQYARSINFSFHHVTCTSFWPDVTCSIPQVAELNNTAFNFILILLHDDCNIKTYQDIIPHLSNPLLLS